MGRDALIITKCGQVTAGSQRKAHALRNAPCDAASLAMGRVERRDGRWRVVEAARAPSSRGAAHGVACCFWT
jgi:hypothetical protein